MWDTASAKLDHVVSAAVFGSAFVAVTGYNANVTIGCTMSAVRCCHV